MSLSKQYLQSLENALKQRNQLKQYLYSKKMLSVGLYEKAKEEQRPIIDAITANANNIVQTKQVTNTTTNPDALLKPVVKVQNYGNKYVPQLTNRTKQGFPIWTLGRNEYVFIEMNVREFIFNISKVNAEPIPLTDGLNEIFFNNGNDMSVITANDVKVWEYLMKESGITSQYKNSAFYSKINPKSSVRMTPQSSKTPIVEYPDGDGLHKTSAITIPSNPTELCEQLELQLKATLAGNTGTFNHVNAILKELMKQKLIDSKYYRKILRIYFHV